MPPAGSEPPDGGTEALLDELDEVVFRTDAEGNWTYLNAAWTRLLGHARSEALGTNFIDYVHPDEVRATVEMFMAVTAGGADFCHHEGRYRRADGSYVWVELRARLRRDEQGRVVGNAGTLVDIDERRRTEEVLASQTRVLELIAADEPLAGVLGAVAAMVARQVDATASIVHFPSTTRADDGGEGDDALGLVVTATPDGRVERGFGPSTHLGASPETFPIRSRTGSETLGAVVVHASGAAALGPPRRAAVARAVDIAAQAIGRAHRQEDVRHQALHDPLTGLPNRWLLDDRLRQATAEARRREAQVALLLLDLDDFKDVNDMLGHDVGDAVLREVARRLSTTLRAVDTVGRLGGDEFVVVLPDVTGAAAAERVARKLLDALAAPFELAGMGLRVRASVGIAVFPGHGDDLEVLLRRADAAMYRVKALGGAAAVFEFGSDEPRTSHVAVAAQLRHAIGAGELVLEYQPKIDLRDGAVLGVEALVRWRHPTRGLVPPDEFIGLAEGTGLMKPLTTWVLEQALTEMKLWAGAPGGMTMAVNLSASLLRDPDLARLVVEAIRRHGLADGQLELEVTESALLGDPVDAMRAMRELDAAGVAFALDDFGTGYSSLSYLKTVPARTLKIDRSFVRDVTSDGRDASIVRTVVDLGHSLGIAVVAEGVEDHDACQLLRALGCDQAQGYHLARPMPVDDLVTWLDGAARTG